MLPRFKYHPDPLRTGSIKASTLACDCCGKARGYEYSGPFYSAHQPTPTLCPWCIANGKAAQKYRGRLVDPDPLLDAEVSGHIAREVSERTPGFSGWQQERWQNHCRDACEFHGDAEPADLRALAGTALAALLENTGMNEKDWRDFLERYQTGGNPSVYKFVCRKCRTSIYDMDFT
jgi:uncharacterized protein